MKKSFLFCAALLLQVVLFSCKEEEDTTGTAGNAVGFSISPISRVAELTESGLKASGFRVSAYSTGVDNWAAKGSSATPGFMYSQSVTWSTDKWTYSDVKYWPGKVNGADYGKVSFFAWSANAESIASVSANTATGAPTLTVTVPDTQADQRDLVTGVVVDETSQTVTGGVVPFAFKHVLSRIGFKAKLKEEYPDATVKVTSLKVKYKANAVEKKGTYTFGDTDGAAGSWALDATYMPSTVSDEVVNAADGVELDNTASLTTKQVNGENAYLMLLPQAVGDGAVVLDVTWTVTATDGAVVTNNQTIELPAQTWEQGWAYDYELVMSLTAVTFGGVTVNPWDDNVLFAPCTITYKANDGTGDDVVEERITNITSYPLWDGNTFTPPTGYAFIGWNTEPNGTGTNYQPGGDITLTGDETLYAKWMPLANCYVVTPDGEVTFPVARAYVDDGLSDKLRVDDQSNYTGSFTAAVVWDDNSVIADATVSGSGKSAVVTVQTNNVSGNAVVAVKKGSDIVWSWHIWVTGYDPAQDAGWSPSSNLGTTSRTTYKFMDRNLGATEAANSLAGRGLFYQWGRKDPFPPKDDVSGFSVADGGSGVTVVQAIQNPGTFYWIANGTNNNDWLSPKDDALWNGAGDLKTIYDPCPAGWRVPLSGASTDSPWSGYTTSQPYDSGTPDDERGYVFPPSTMSGYNAGTHTQSYWPAAGYRSRTTGALAGSGAFGGYWSGTVTGINAYGLGFTSGTIVPSNYGNRAFGYSVRCVKE